MRTNFIFDIAVTKGRGKGKQEDLYDFKQSRKAQRPKKKLVTKKRALSPFSEAKLKKSKDELAIIEEQSENAPEQ